MYFSKHKLFLLTVLSLTYLSALSALSAKAIEAREQLPADKCFESKNHNFSEVLGCYRDTQEKLPLVYSKIHVEKIGEIEKRTYELTSQSWMTNGSVTPERWMHSVDIYIPDNALSKRAVLIVNNGINTEYENNSAKGPSDYSEETLRAIAWKTRTVTISVSNVPNQYLKYRDDDVPKREDDSVAHSWRLFLDAPDEHAFISLHIPMMEAVVKAMDLAENELKDLNIHRFIVAGTSKRAWTSWHTALADPRVDAIVPFVIDILNTKEVLEHEYLTYGKGWPIAFKPYFREGITEKLDTTAFDKLMKIEDPMRYLDSAYANRLNIPKYIVNASGDNFFTPDNAQLYFDKLPGIKMLRVAPNSDHYGISKFTENALVPFVNRLQQSISFPVLTSSLSKAENKMALRVAFSETPIEALQWTATNPNARDFRYACGIRYVSSPLKINSTNDVSSIIENPTTGWSAVFVEVRFKDGLISTSPVYITPDENYSYKSDPDAASSCQTIR